MSAIQADATVPNSVHAAKSEVSSHDEHNRHSEVGELSEKDVERAENPIAAQEAPADANLSDEHYARGARLTLIMTSVMLFVFLVALDQTIVSTAIPIVTNEFNSFSDVGWYGSAYLLTSAAFQPLFGRLYQSFDIKIVYLIALFIFEIGSLICAVAQDSTTFIVGRAIAGLGLAGGYSGSMVVVNIAAPLEVRPLLTSLMGAAYGVGASLGPIIGGAFTSHATWRWCFYINLIFYAIVGPLILILLKLPNVKHEKTIVQRLLLVDWAGSGLIVCSLVCLLLALQWGGITYAWGDSKVIGLIVGFVAIGAAFIGEQWYLKDNALIPFRYFKQRTVGFGAIVNFGVASVYFAELYFLPLYFQSVRGSSAIRSGVELLPYILSVIFTVTVAGGIVNKTGIYIPILIFGTALTALAGGVLYFLEPGSSQSEWIGLLFFAGFGPGMSFMIPFIASCAALPPQDIAIGSVSVLFAQTLGGSIFVSVAQSVFQNKFVLYVSKIPGADAQTIVSKGVSAFREFTPVALLPAVLEAFNQALQRVWIMVGVLGAVAFLAVFGMELNRRIPLGSAAMAA